MERWSFGAMEFWSKLIKETSRLEILVGLTERVNELECRGDLRTRINDF